jgi:long-subunit acyl-CoA synthetase (AMP-forming)/GNAT superfamily N-acetyltransferase
MEQWKTLDPRDPSAPSLALRMLREAQGIVRKGRLTDHSRGSWLDYLETTRKPFFLRSLGNAEERNGWSELVFRLLQHTNYTLRDMIFHRVSEHPARVLFQDMSAPEPVEWSYEQIYRHIREIAAVFYRSVKVEPRVALYTENCLEGACVDLSCLSFEIFITPLSTHFSTEILRDIFDRLNIGIALADSRERLLLLQKLRQKTRKRFLIFSLIPGVIRSHDILSLSGECKKLGQREIQAALASHQSASNRRVATTMFTSGSTGIPKGVSFSIYNIVSKRFARAAALPEVGEETFLCYLPLYHTFGRYLEMTGAIFWGGSYVFAGNTSAETLFSLFPKVNPTGFISIPLRWQELYEKCRDGIRSIDSVDLKERTVREIVGGRLKWGLSAAGYLDPVVFRFFNQYGIRLCSGFGMTEATGGITMTPPGQYRDNTVGIPLPGVYAKLTGESELLLRGHYIGRYLEDAGPGRLIPYPVSGEKDRWLPTGDVFRITRDGFYQIVDRVKDIYKNNRGQTVAPQVVEKKFFNVPGITSTFVVGDNRPYNVLLIVPDRNDPLFRSLSGENLTEYFHRIVMSANSDVASYERVVNFTLLDRDFSAARGEITPKGSFNRKTIVKNFSRIIESLYISNTVSITCGKVMVSIPRWFFRDLGILETDILVRDKQLFNRRSRQSLPVRRTDRDHCQVGDFRYKIPSGEIDLGLFARQPRLWVGNPSLIAFSPVREGWDSSLGEISPFLYFTEGTRHRKEELSLPRSIRDPQLAKANALVCRALFTEPEVCIEAIEDLGKIFGRAEPRLAEVIQRRLESLAYHPSEEVRALSYRILLMKAPYPDQISSLPSFINSGLTFLNERSIREIASSNFGKHRLDALKQRLYWYRTHLRWPATKKNQALFGNVLKMLFEFARRHPDYYVPIRAELSRWILHRKDPVLSRKAEELFNLLAGDFEKKMDKRFPRPPLRVWKDRLMFEHGISESEKGRITRIFHSSTFLQESILLAFNEPDFSLEEVSPKGIWILRLQAFKAFRHYRLSINTLSGKHFELHMVLSDTPSYRPNPETFYWMASLAGFPYGPAVAPILGSSRPGIGILSTQYIGGLTAWDRIREFSGIHKSAGYLHPNAWKKVFTRAFAAIFTAWHHSGYQIVPGVITPSNVVVPEMDFRESAVIVTLTGWTRYTGPLSLVQPMLQDFYHKTAALYPWCGKQLKITWIFDAAIEALGREEAGLFLNKLLREFGKKSDLFYGDQNLRERLEEYLGTDMKTYLPLALHSAIDQYAEWYRMNPYTSSAAKEQTLFELLELFRLQGYPDLVRYYFYRYTYFSDAREEIRESFDRLIRKMQSDQKTLSIQLGELSDLQSALLQPEDKNVFSRMVFPRLHGEQNIELLRIGESRKDQIIVRFNLQDKLGMKYVQREPIEPREVGQLYQLFFRENYPKEISDTDNHFIVIDENEKLVGGLTWRYLDPKNALLDGIVVTSSLQGRGIASAMIENLFASLSARGIRVIKAHFLFGNYYLKHYFEVDKKWGALIKKLG